MGITSQTQVTVSCDNAACPNIGNYGSLTPALSTTDPTGWIDVRFGRIASTVVPAAQFAGIFCSKACARAGLQAAAML
jgi:hypothetical protein